MKTAFVVALSGFLIGAAAPRVFDRDCDFSSRRSGRGGVFCSAAGDTPFTPRIAFNMPLVRALPDPHVDPNGIGECHFIAAATANGCDTVCTKGDGGPLCDGAGGLVDPHTATCINTPWGKGYDITAASQAPSCDSAHLRTQLADDGGTGLSGPETSYALTNLRTTGSPVKDLNFIFDMFPAAGPNYRQMVNDITGVTYGLGAGFLCSPGNASQPTQPVNAWALTSCAYTGGSGAFSLLGNVQSVYTSTLTNVPRGDFSPLAKLWIGAQDPNAFFGTTAYLNGSIVHLSWFREQHNQTRHLVELDKTFGVYSSVGHLIPHQLNTVQGNGEDWTGVTGNVEPVFTPVGMIDPTLGYGIRATSAVRNNAAANVLDLASLTDVGVVVVNNNTSAGFFSTWKNASTTDEIVCASPGCGKQTLNIFDGGTNWYNFRAAVKQGLTGVERTKVDLTILTDGTLSMADGGASGLCSFTGLNGTHRWVECKAKVSGSPTTVTAKVTVPAAGSVQVEAPQWVVGPSAQQPWDTATERGATWYEIPVTSFPDMTQGAKVETCFVSPRSTSDYTAGTRGKGILYLLDMAAAGDHAGAFIIVGEGLKDGGPGTTNILTGMRSGSPGENDLEDEGNTITAGVPYCIAIEARKHGAGCDLRMYFNACSGTLADGGTGCTNPDGGGDAVTLVASDLTGTKSCPTNPTSACLGNRCVGLLVETDVAYVAPLRIWTP